MNDANFNLVMASMIIAVFSTLGAASTWHSAARRFKGPGFWMMSFALLALSMAVSSLDIPGLEGWLAQGIANTLEIAGAYLQFLGMFFFVEHKDHRLRGSLLAIVAIMSLGGWYHLAFYPFTVIPFLAETLSILLIALVNVYLLGHNAGKSLFRQRLFPLASLLVVTFIMFTNLIYCLAKMQGAPTFTDSAWFYYGPITWMVILSILATAENQLVNSRISGDFAALAGSHDLTQAQLLESNRHLHQAQDEILLTLSGVMESRSSETAFHVVRVAEFSRLLARHAGLPEVHAELIAQAAPLHDIGKIGIPDFILFKPGPLTDHEREVMKTHTRIGHAILDKSGLPLFKTAALIALEHHEHWDGSGYPEGKTGAEISMAGRIVALADQFDALLSPRIYKERWPMEQTLDYIRAQRGRRFDPLLCSAVLEHWPAFAELWRSNTRKEENAGSELN